MIHSLFIIPVLGALRNYVKYKRVSPLLFLRTPFLYSFLYTFLTIFRYENRICLTIINERIFMFIYKISISLINDDYNRRKEKYIKKHGLEYKNKKIDYYKWNICFMIREKDVLFILHFFCFIILIILIFKRMFLMIGESLYHI